MQLVKVCTIGHVSDIDWLLIVNDDTASEDYLQKLADEYSLDLTDLRIEKQMRLFDGDLPMSVGQVFELVLDDG